MPTLILISLTISHVSAAPYRSRLEVSMGGVVARTGEPLRCGEIEFTYWGEPEGRFSYSVELNGVEVTRGRDVGVSEDGLVLHASDPGNFTFRVELRLYDECWMESEEEILEGSVTAVRGLCVVGYSEDFRGPSLPHLICRFFRDDAAWAVLTAALTLGWLRLPYRTGPRKGDAEPNRSA